MLGDADQSFAKAPDFPEDVFKAVGGLVLGLGAGEKIVDFLQKRDVPEPVGFTLAEAIQMDPPEQDVAQENAQWFGQFLIQFNDDWPVQQLLQLQRMPGVERAGGRAKGERAQDSLATVLPEHAPAPILHPVQFLGGIKEIRILLHLPVVKPEILKLFVQGFDQNVRHPGTGEMGFFQCLGHGTDPGFGMNAGWTAQRIPVERGMAFPAHRIDLDGFCLGQRQGTKQVIRPFPIHDEEWNVLVQQSEQQQLGDVGFAGTGGGAEGNMAQEIVFAQIQRPDRFFAVKNRAQQKFTGGGLRGRWWQQDRFVADIGGEILCGQKVDERLGFLSGLWRLSGGIGCPQGIRLPAQDGLELFTKTLDVQIPHG